MSLDIGGIELFMGPTELGSPDNLEHTITGFIDSADDTLDIAVQELESLPITQAVVRARATRSTERTGIREGQ